MAESTRLRVLDAAGKLNFRPSSAARALSRRQQGLIGILTPQFDGSFFGYVLNIAEREIRREGKHLMVASSKNANGATGNDLEALSFLEARDCDGILILQSAWNDRELVLLAERLPALALFNRDVPALAEHCFVTDHYAAGRAVAEHLLGAGHRQFAAIAGPLHRPDAERRHRGFSDALDAAGCPLDPRLVFEGDYFFTGGTAGAHSLLGTALPFTAVFCGNDEMAIASNLVFQDAGRAVELFGYDNIDTLRYSGLKIGSVAVPVEEMVTNACAYLLNCCYGGKREITRRFVAEMVLRKR